MLFRNVIDLLTVTDGTNENGFPTKVITGRKTVYANKKSIRQSEFYMAAQSGIQVDMMFEIRTCDYAGETYLEHESKQYKIIRTYDRNGEIIELVCSDLSTKGGIEADVS